MNYTLSPSGNTQFPDDKMPCPKCGFKFQRYEGNEHRPLHQYWHCPSCGTPLTLHFRLTCGKRVDSWTKAPCRGCSDLRLATTSEIASAPVQS